MMMLQTALMILNNEIGAAYEDRIEAYQFLNDNFYLDRLNHAQRAEFNHMVESGIIETAPWRNWES